MADFSPMMQQYLETKKKYPGCILFYRLGDFYEMFFDDAKLASRELELTLTGRECGQPERAPMCGVPYHSAETYIARLIAKGYKVAICEQMEDPATAKGLVKREIVRVVTPGTVLESSMLDEGRNNYLASVFWGDASCGVCFADVSTGEVYVTTIRPAAAQLLCDELARYAPREVLFNSATLDQTEVGDFIRTRLHASGELMLDETFVPDAEQRVQLQFGQTLPDQPEAMLALSALVVYLTRTQRTGLERVHTLRPYEQAQFMRLDLTARRNLELTETMRAKEKRGSLLGVLDRTHTAMGKRLIRQWLEQPLMQYAAIERRLSAVDELVRDGMRRDTLTAALTGVFDLERLMTRIVYGSANGRDLRSLCATARQLPAVCDGLTGAEAPLLLDIAKRLDPLTDIADQIDAAIVDEPPVTVRDGGVIRPGYRAALDELTQDLSDGQGILARIEAEEKAKTGIKNLRTGYNRVFGYYIEIPNSARDAVPDEYIRKQTLTNCERYITPGLKELENRILGARERALQMEFALFDEVRSAVAAQLDRVQTTAHAAAELDVLCAFAEAAQRGGYCRPTINFDGRIRLRDCRHPVVESIATGAPFVPNDALLDGDDNRCAIITGPNMAGKSTYMRQTALACLMAQCGSFVAASEADVCILDGIYTRVGASDDLTSGQSTFMVEMSEMAEILAHATDRSLLILDEIGRGTSTYDGMSIARAVVEYVSDKRTLGAKTMFATHYHELTALENELQGVRNYNIAVKKHGDDITFLRRIVRGGADESFGIEVARLAGLPDAIIRRARVFLKELESTGTASAETAKKSARKAPQPTVAQGQLTLADPAADALRAKLRAIDLNVLTPIEAMNKLYELCEEANRS